MECTYVYIMFIYYIIIYILQENLWTKKPKKTQQKTPHSKNDLCLHDTKKGTRNICKKCFTEIIICQLIDKISYVVDVEKRYFLVASADLWFPYELVKSCLQVYKAVLQKTLVYLTKQESKIKLEMLKKKATTIQANAPKI